MSTGRAVRGWSGFLLWLLLILVAAALGAGLWLSSRPGPVRLQGTVQARQVNVSTRVTGRVEQIHASVGAQVKAGQLLVVLSNPELASAQAQATGAVALTEAHSRIAADAVRKEDVDSAYAVWQAAQAQADLAAASARRAEALFAEGVIAAQRRDEARALGVSATRNAEAAQAQWQKMKAGARQEARDAARA